MFLGNLKKINRINLKFLTYKNNLQFSKRFFLEIGPFLDKKKIYKQEQIVNFSREQLFNIVAKTEDYEKFLPGCHKSITKYKKDNKIYVELEIGFPPLLENYISEVTLSKPSEIVAKSKNGKLFNNLTSKWSFQDAKNGDPKNCLVIYEVEFEFKSSFYLKLGETFFDLTTKNILKAFLFRAESIYGKK